MEEASPYTPSDFAVGADKSAHRKRGRWTARVAVALFAGPVWGMIGTVIGMARAYGTFELNGSSTQPEALAGGVGFAFRSAMIGISVGLIGAVLIPIALFAAKNREKWFFWWSVLLSLFWCSVIFPGGLIVGLPILILFIVKRADFGDPTNA